MILSIDSRSPSRNLFSSFPPSTLTNFNPCDLGCKIHLDSLKTSDILSSSNAKLRHVPSTWILQYCTSDLIIPQSSRPSNKTSSIPSVVQTIISSSHSDNCTLSSSYLFIIDLLLFPLSLHYSPFKSFLGILIILKNLKYPPQDLKLSFQLPTGLTHQFFHFLLATYHWNSYLTIYSRLILSHHSKLFPFSLLVYHLLPPILTHAFSSNFLSQLRFNPLCFYTLNNLPSTQAHHNRRSFDLVTPAPKLTQTLVHNSEAVFKLKSNPTLSSDLKLKTNQFDLTNSLSSNSQNLPSIQKLQNPTYPSNYLNHPQTEAAPLHVNQEHSSTYANTDHNHSNLLLKSKLHVSQKVPLKPKVSIPDRVTSYYEIRQFWVNQIKSFKTPSKPKRKILAKLQNPTPDFKLISTLNHPSNLLNPKETLTGKKVITEADSTKTTPKPLHIRPAIVPTFQQPPKVFSHNPTLLQDPPHLAHSDISSLKNTHLALNTKSSFKTIEKLKQNQLVHQIELLDPTFLSSVKEILKDKKLTNELSRKPTTKLVFRPSPIQPFAKNHPQRISQPALDFQPFKTSGALVSSSTLKDINHPNFLSHIKNHNSRANQYSLEIAIGPELHKQFVRLLQALGRAQADSLDKNQHSFKVFNFPPILKTEKAPLLGAKSEISTLASPLQSFTQANKQNILTIHFKGNSVFLHHPLFSQLVEYFKGPKSQLFTSFIIKKFDIAQGKSASAKPWFSASLNTPPKALISPGLKSLPSTSAHVVENARSQSYTQKLTDWVTFAAWQRTWGHSAFSAFQKITQFVTGFKSKVKVSIPAFVPEFLNSNFFRTEKNTQAALAKLNQMQPQKSSSSIRVIRELHVPKLLETPKNTKLTDGSFSQSSLNFKSNPVLPETRVINVPRLIQHDINQKASSERVFGNGMNEDLGKEKLLVSNHQNQPKNALQTKQLNEPNHQGDSSHLSSVSPERNTVSSTSAVPKGSSKPKSINELNSQSDVQQSPRDSPATPTSATSKGGNINSREKFPPIDTDFDKLEKPYGSSPRRPLVDGPKIMEKLPRPMKAILRWLPQLAKTVKSLARTIKRFLSMEYLIRTSRPPF
ncbi:hypothetical protein O181_031081 [Austropuccinia psidii MF-1]|uniref:Uncharacterized protein n=1 Tax=Austropuccinia psidii MF-1 TaxID=1389203 RepID=A0A9Q3H4V0_9BASI|nr:hypothetical protein [Austropuccinia psidii MF-1]